MENRTALGSFATLGVECFKQLLLRDLVDNNLQAAINLSLTNFVFAALLDDALAQKLLQLLVSITYLREGTSEKMLQQNILDTADLIVQKPQLLFRHTRDNMTPVQYLFSTVDIFFQQCAFDTAEKYGLMQKFVDQVHGVKCQSLERVGDLVQVFKEHQQEVEKLPDHQDPHTHIELLNNQTRTLLGRAQLALERGLLDDAFSPDDNCPDGLYRLDDDVSGRTINVLDFAAGDKLGENFMLFKHDDGKLLPRRDFVTSDYVKAQCNYWCSLFLHRQEKRQAFIDSAVERVEMDRQCNQ